MFTVSTQASACSKLLENYEREKKIYKVSKLVFEGAEGLDVYNISVPFEDGGDVCLAGRLDRRDSEISRVGIFRKGHDAYSPVHPSVTFRSLQDPFVARIHGEIILGGVQVDSDPLYPEKIIGYRTLFYRGGGIHSLHLFAAGPNRMKDIRLVELPDGGVGVFTRPQGGKAGKGKAGFVRVDRLEDVGEESIGRAKLIDGLFTDDEWGGVNQVHVLRNGLLGIVGHIACMTEETVRHYFSCSFVFDPVSFEHSAVKIIARRSDLLDGPAKRPDLRDVLFSGGLIRKGRRADLYTGVSDAEAQCLEIDDPFLAYEQESTSPAF